MIGASGDPSSQSSLLAGDGTGMDFSFSITLVIEAYVCADRGDWRKPSEAPAFYYSFIYFYFLRQDFFVALAFPDFTL